MFTTNMIPNLKRGLIESLQTVLRENNHLIQSFGSNLESRSFDELQNFKWNLRNENGYISVNHMIGRVVNNVEELISTVYPDIFNLSNKSYQWLCERAIISPRNVTAGEINDIILLKFDGHSRESIY